MLYQIGIENVSPERQRLLHYIPPNEIKAADVGQDTFFSFGLTQVQEHRRALYTLTLGVLPALLALVGAAAILVKADEARLRVVPPFAALPVSRTATPAERAYTKNLSRQFLESHNRAVRIREKHLALFGVLGFFLFQSIGFYVSALRLGLKWQPAWQVKSDAARLDVLCSQTAVTKLQGERLSRGARWMCIAAFWMAPVAFFVFAGPS